MLVKEDYGVMRRTRKSGRPVKSCLRKEFESVGRCFLMVHWSEPIQLPLEVQSGPLEGQLVFPVVWGLTGLLCCQLRTLKKQPRAALAWCASSRSAVFVGPIGVACVSCRSRCLGGACGLLLMTSAGVGAREPIIGSIDMPE